MFQKNIKRIRYLSQGTIETGGYRHEKKLAQLLHFYLEKFNENTILSEIRLSKQVNSIWGYIQLVKWFFKQSSAAINIVPLRGALPCMFRTFFSKSKTIIVLHSEVQPYSSAWLKINYHFLIGVFRIIKPKNAVIVTIAEIWKQKFESQGISNRSVFIVPNLFDVSFFISYKTEAKKKQIHLGMYSPKTDVHIYDLARTLSKMGYYCYFSSLDESKQTKHIDYDIIFFNEYEDYLRAMAQSQFTIQFPSIEEGWSRVAHESILVGTKVIGIAIGGLAQLLIESGSVIVKDKDGFVNAILRNEESDAFLISTFESKYNEANAQIWVEPLIKFCNSE